MKAKRVGIRDVAKLAEVSVATVSMVLNDNPKITAPTCRRVRQAMEETGYRPNRIAQSLSSKHTRMIAVMLPTLRHVLADPYFGELLSGICDRAARRGHKVVLEHAKPDFIREKKHLELIDRRFVDGVLSLGFSDRYPFLGDFHEQAKPAIAVNSVFPLWEMDTVVSDYAGGAQQAMTYLLQLGHRRIGMVHGFAEIATAELVRGEYRRLAGETGGAGLGLDASWEEDGQFTEVGGRDAAARLFERHPDMTAIFAGNDKMAIGVMHYLKSVGRSVPGDVSVIGIDDLPYSAFVTPALTTVHLPLYEVGATACERLIEVIRGRTGGVAEMLPTHLVLRDSTGRPPGDG